MNPIQVINNCPWRRCPAWDNGFPRLTPYLIPLVRGLFLWVIFTKGDFFLIFFLLTQGIFFVPRINFYATVRPFFSPPSSFFLRLCVRFCWFCWLLHLAYGQGNGFHRNILFRGYDSMLILFSRFAVLCILFRVVV